SPDQPAPPRSPRVWRAHGREEAWLSGPRRARRKPRRREGHVRAMSRSMASIGSIALLLVVLQGPVPDALAQESVPTAPQPAYVARGDEVEARYEVYRARLERFYEALRARIEGEAPDLRASLEPPAPVPYGYRILPRFVPDSPPPAGPRHIASTVFSWSRTESLVDHDQGQLATLESLLHAPLKVPGDQPRPDHN